MAIINNNPRLEEYELLHDAYYGSGMFATGAAITEHARESAQSIAFRRKIAYYSNTQAAEEYHVYVPPFQTIEPQECGRYYARLCR